MTLSRAGFLTLAPDSFYMSSLGESPEEKILGSQYWEYFLPLGNWLIFRGVHAQEIPGGKPEV